MTVPDDSAGTGDFSLEQPSPFKVFPDSAGTTLEAESSPAVEAKRVCIFRDVHEWQRIRTRYETAQPLIPLRKLSQLEAIPLSTLMKRAASEHWKQPRGIIAKTKTALLQATDEAIHLAVQDAATATAKTLIDQLQPIIEREKAEHIKTQIVRSKGHLNRLDGFLKRKHPLAPKDEANVAKAVSSHVMDLRRTLGLGDDTGLSGSLSVRVLTDGAAIEVQAS